MLKIFLNILTFFLVAYLCAFAIFFTSGKIDVNIGGFIRILMERWEQPFLQFLVFFGVWLAAQRKYNKKRFGDAFTFLSNPMDRLRRGFSTQNLPDVVYNPAERAGGMGRTQTLALVAAALLAGILLRLYHLPFIYFHFDAVSNMMAGDDTIAAHFLLTHSLHSSMGPPHPPMFNYTQGFFMTISRDPVVIAGMMSLLNIAALAVFARAMLYSEPLYFALVSIGLLAVNSALFFYSTIIWQPALMPVPMMLFHAKLLRFIKGKKARNLAWAFAFATAATQFHIGGFLLYPALAIVVFSFRKEAGAKGLTLALMVSAIVCSPYLYYLLAEGGIANFFNTAVGSKREFSLEAVEEFISMSGAMLSPRIFAYWLGPADYDFVMQRDAGPFGGALKLAGHLAEISFAAGMIRYLVMVVSARSFFPKALSGERAQNPPVSFQLAGLIVTLVSLGFIFFRITVFPHYLTYLFPSYVILAAWAPSRLCGYMAGRAASLFMIAGHTALAGVILVAINTAGGHSLVYGPSYRTVMRIKDAVRQINPENRPIDLYLDKRGSRAIYGYVFEYLLQTDGEKDSPNKMPVLVSVTWDHEQWKFEWFARNLESRPGERSAAIQQALELVPQGARLVAHPDFSKYLRGRANTVVSETPAHETAAEYVLADIKYPPYAPTMNTYAERSAKAMLLDRRYGLIYDSSGILLFKAGAQKTMDHGEYEKIAFTFKAVDMKSGGGYRLVRPDSKSGVTRRILNEPASKGVYMVFGPYIDLPPGEYTASFRLFIEKQPRQASAVAVLDVVSDNGSVKLGEKTIKPGDSGNAGEWSDFAVPFTVGPQGAQASEFRILYLGGPEIQADTVTISMDDQTFNSMLQN